MKAMRHCIRATATPFACVFVCIALGAQWGDWTVISECSVTCDTGVEVIQRHCHNVSSAANDSCQGDMTMTRRCTLDSCTDIGNWRQLHSTSGARSVVFYSGKLHENITFSANFTCNLDRACQQRRGMVSFKRKLADESLFRTMVNLYVMNNTADVHNFNLRNLSISVTNVMHALRFYISLPLLSASDAGVYRCACADLTERLAPQTVDRERVWDEEIIVVSDVRLIPLFREHVTASPGRQLAWRVLIKISAGSRRPLPKFTYFGGGFWRFLSREESQRFNITQQSTRAEGTLQFHVVFIAPRGERIDNSTRQEMYYRQLKFRFELVWASVVNLAGDAVEPVIVRPTPTFTQIIKSCSGDGCWLCSSAGDYCHHCEVGFYRQNQTCRILEIDDAPIVETTSRYVRNPFLARSTTVTVCIIVVTFALVALTVVGAGHLMRNVEERFWELQSEHRKTSSIASVKRPLPSPDSRPTKSALVSPDSSKSRKSTEQKIVSFREILVTPPQESTACTICC